MSDTDELRELIAELVARLEERDDALHGARPLCERIEQVAAEMDIGPVFRVDTRETWLREPDQLMPMETFTQCRAEGRDPYTGQLVEVIWHVHHADNSADHHLPDMEHVVSYLRYWLRYLDSPAEADGQEKRKGSGKSVGAPTTLTEDQKNAYINEADGYTSDRKAGHDMEIGRTRISELRKELDRPRRH